MRLFNLLILLVLSRGAYAIKEGPIYIGESSAVCAASLISESLTPVNEKQVEEAEASLKLGISTILVENNRNASQLRAMILHLGKQFPGLEVTAPSIYQYGLTVGLNLRRWPPADVPSHLEDSKL